MKRFVVAAAAALALQMSPIAVMAADPAPPVASQAEVQPSPEAMALTKRYFVALQMDQRMHSLVANLLPVIISETSSELPETDDAQKQVISDATQEAMDAWFPKYMDRMEVLYAKLFTVDELQGLVAFYEGPIGKSVVAKEGTMAPAATQVMVEMEPQLQSDMLRRLCRKIDCTKLQAKPATAS